MSSCSHGGACLQSQGEEAASQARSKARTVIEEVIEALPFPAVANDWQCEEISCAALNDHYVENKGCPREFLLNKNNRVLDPTHLTSLPAAVRLGIRAAMAYGLRYDTHFESVMSDAPTDKFMKTISMRTVLLDGQRFVIGLQHHMGKDMRYGIPHSDWWQFVMGVTAKKADASGLSVSWVSEEETERWQGVLSGIFEQTETLCQKEDVDRAFVKSMENQPHPLLICDPFLPECPVIGLNKAAQALTGWGEVGTDVIRADAKLLEGAEGLDRGAYHLTYGKYAAGEEEERLEGVTVAQGVNAGPLGGGANIWYLVGILSDCSKEQWDQNASSSPAMDAVRSAVEQLLACPDEETSCEDEAAAQSAGTHPYGGDVRLLKQPLWHTRRAAESKEGS